MNEKVLAVPRNAIEAHLRQGFFELSSADLIGVIGEVSVFLDRALAEKDITHKQIIPYIVVSHEGRFLVYRRTPKQGEPRLHNKYSLGFGGHINDGDFRQATDTNVILTAMIRELNEELYVPAVKKLTVVGFINDDTNPVGQVHLGVAVFVETANDQFAVNEPEMIEAQWCDANAVEEVFPKLESWSQMLWTQHFKRSA